MASDCKAGVLALFDSWMIRWLRVAWCQGGALVRNKLYPVLALLFGTTMWPSMVAYGRDSGNIANELNGVLDRDVNASAQTQLQAKEPGRTAQTKMPVQVPPTLEAQVQQTSGCRNVAQTKASAEPPQASAEVVLAPKLRSVALVLGGGGLKAVGAIGAIKVLEREHVPVNYIYGTSCGAFIGALYAYGVPIKEIESLFVNGTWQRAVTHQLLLKALCTPLTAVGSVRARNKWPGILAGTHYETFLRSHLPPTFAALKIPFRAVAVDLCSGENVCLKSGDLSQAVLASCAMPPFIRPVEWGDRLLIDGGLRGNLPVDCARQSNEADIIIACSSDGQIRPRSKDYFDSIPRLNRRAMDMLFHQTDATAMNECDILIEPDIDDVPMMTKNRKKIKAAIDAGELAAVRNLHGIQQALAVNGSMD
jgi:NTE family protein